MLKKIIAATTLTLAMALAPVAASAHPRSFPHNHRHHGHQGHHGHHGHHHGGHHGHHGGHHGGHHH